MRASGGDNGQNDPDSRLVPTAPKPPRAAGPEIDRGRRRTRHAWLSSHAAAPRSRRDTQDDEEAALFESLYPSNATAADMLERRTRPQTREAARLTQAQNYDNTMRAAAGDGDPADPEGGGNPHHEVIDHPQPRSPTTTTSTPATRAPPTGTRTPTRVTTLTRPNPRTTSTSSPPRTRSRRGSRSGSRPAPPLATRTLRVR